MPFTHMDAVTVTSDSSKLPSTQTDFPVLYSLQSDFLKSLGNSGFVANANGYDIRFFSNSSLTIAIPFDLESYDPTTGTVVFWTKISSLSLGAKFYVGFGDPTLNTNASSTATWNSSYVMVQHLPTQNAILGTSDSTSNAIDGTPVNGPTAQTGHIDGAALFDDASAQFISFGDPSEVNFGTGNFTFQAWINPNDLSANTFPEILSKNSLAEGSFQWVLLGQGTVANVRTTVFGAHITAYDSGLEVSENSWQSLTTVRDGNVPGSLKLYVDSLPRTFTFSIFDDFPTTMNDTVADMEIAAREATGFEGYFPGGIDEVRILNTALTADWILAEYQNQVAPTTPGINNFLTHDFMAVSTATVLGGSNIMIGVPNFGPNIVQIGIGGM